MLAIVGLAFEARIAERASGVRAVIGRGRALAEAEALAGDAACAGVVSVGLAGGLDPALRPGNVVIGRAVVVEGQSFPCDEQWADLLARRIGAATSGRIAAGKAPVLDVAGKRALRGSTGALAVDVESGAAATLAKRSGRRLAVVRVVADPAERSVPPAALAGMRPDGRTDALAVLAALMRWPGDLPGLLRVARDAGIARRRLAALCRPSGGGLHALDLGDLLLDVP